MSISSFCLWQKEREEEALRKLLLIGLGGSLFLHLAFALGWWWLNREPQIAEEPIEFILVEADESETVEPAVEEITPEQKPDPAVETPIEPEQVQLRELTLPTPIPEPIPLTPSEIRQTLSTSDSASPSPFNAHLSSSASVNSTSAVPTPSRSNSDSTSSAKQQSKVQTPNSERDPSESQIAAATSTPIPPTPSQSTLNAQLNQGSASRPQENPLDANMAAPGKVAPNRPLSLPNPVADASAAPVQDMSQLPTELNQAASSPAPEQASAIAPANPEEVALRPIAPLSSTYATFDQLKEDLQRDNSPSQPLAESAPQLPGEVVITQVTPRQMTGISATVSPPTPNLSQLRAGLTSNPTSLSQQASAVEPGQITAQQSATRRSPQVTASASLPSSNLSELRRSLESDSLSATSLGDSGSEASPAAPGTTSSSQSTPSPLNRILNPVASASEGLQQLREQLRANSAGGASSGSQSPNPNPASTGRANANPLAALGASGVGNSIRGQGQVGGLRCLQGCPPPYPREFQERRLEGRPIVEFVVTEEGDVINPRVAEPSPHRELNEAALAAVARMKFDPPIGGSRSARMPINYAVRGSNFYEQSRQRVEENQRTRDEQEYRRQYSF